MWQFNFLLRRTQWLELNKAREKYQGVKIIPVSVSLCLSERWENVVKAEFNSTRLPQDWKAGEHYRWLRHWPNNIQQTKKRRRRKKKSINFNMSPEALHMSSEGLQIFSFHFLQGIKELGESVRFLIDNIQLKEVYEKAKNKKEGHLHWMPTMAIGWYCGQREE